MLPDGVLESDGSGNGSIQQGGRRRENPRQEEHASVPASIHLPAFGVVRDWITSYQIDGQAVGGTVDLTRDQRFHAWLETGVKIEGRRVLELGSLEGAHTAMLCRAKARQVVGVEGRAENFVKCCIVKNVLSLDRATFVFDDIANVTPAVYGRFDVALASGVLYHLADPLRVIRQLFELAPVVMIWTHIATEHYPRGRTATLMDGDRPFRGKWYREPKSLLAGLDRKSFWPYLPDLRRMFTDAGFRRIDELAVDENHSQGAAWLGTVWAAENGPHDAA